MDERGRNLIRELKEGGLKREEIREELRISGYDSFEVETEINNAFSATYEAIQLGKDRALTSNTPSAFRGTANNMVTKQTLQPKESSYRIWMIFAITIIALVRFHFIGFGDNPSLWIQIPAIIIISALGGLVTSLILIRLLSKQNLIESSHNTAFIVCTTILAVLFVVLINLVRILFVGTQGLFVIISIVLIIIAYAFFVNLLCNVGSKGIGLSMVLTMLITTNFIVPITTSIAGTGSLLQLTMFGAGEYDSTWVRIVPNELKTDGTIDVTIANHAGDILSIGPRWVGGNITIDSVFAESKGVKCGSYNVKTEIPFKDEKEIIIPANANCAGSKGEPYEIVIYVIFEKKVDWITIKHTVTNTIKWTYT